MVAKERAGSSVKAFEMREEPMDYMEQALARDRIAELRAEAAHDALVRACRGQTRRTGGRVRRDRGLFRRWVPWGQAPVASPLD